MSTRQSYHSLKLADDFPAWKKRAATRKGKPKSLVPPRQPTFRFTTIPINWRNRRTGTAKLKIKEMGSRYLFICLYVWLEKYFPQCDYRRLPR